MKTLLIILAVFGLWAAIPLSSESAVALFTPTLSNGAGDYIYCTAVNTTGSSISVTFRLMRFDGILIQTHTYAIAPGRAILGIGWSSTNPSLYFCKFVAPTATSIRGAGQLWNPSTYRLYFSVQAQ